MIQSSKDSSALEVHHVLGPPRASNQGFQDFKIPGIARSAWSHSKSDTHDLRKRSADYYDYYYYYYDDDDYYYYEYYYH